MFGLKLKTDTGRLNTVQRDTIAALRTAGAVIEVAHGLDDALAWLERHGRMM